MEAGKKGKSFEHSFVPHCARLFIHSTILFVVYWKIHATIPSRSLIAWRQSAIIDKNQNQHPACQLLSASLKRSKKQQRMAKKFSRAGILLNIFNRFLPQHFLYDMNFVSQMKRGKRLFVYSIRQAKKKGISTKKFAAY